MKSNKTNILGILTILIGVLNAVYEYMSGQQVNITTLGVAFSSGTGLLAAKDHDVTGGTVTQPTVANPPTLVEVK